MKDAEAYTGYKRSYLYKLMHAHRIAYYRPNGGKVFFLEEDLKAFLLQGRQAADIEIAEIAERFLARRKS